MWSEKFRPTGLQLILTFLVWQIYDNKTVIVTVIVNEAVDDKLENVAIANTRPPEPRQSSAALITTPCQVWSRNTFDGHPLRGC